MAGPQEPGRPAGGDKAVGPDVGLQATALAAGTRWAVVGHDDVADLSGAPLGATLEDAVVDAGETDAAAHGHHDEATAGAPEAVEPLGHGQGFDVVLDQHRCADGLAQLPAEGHPGPAEHVGVNVTDVGTSDHARNAHADAEKAGGAGTDEGAQAGQQPGDGVEGQGVKALGGGGEHVAVEADVDQDQVVGGQLYPDGVAGIGDQAEELARPATLGRRIVERLDDALVDEPPGDLADGGRAQVEVAGNGGPRRRPVASQQGEDGYAGEVASPDVFVVHGASYVSHCRNVSRCSWRRRRWIWRRNLR